MVMSKALSLEVAGGTILFMIINFKLNWEHILYNEKNIPRTLLLNKVGIYVHIFTFQKIRNQRVFLFHNAQPKTFSYSIVSIDLST